MTQKDLETIREALEDALAEVTQCDEISQGVEDKLDLALEIVNNNGTEE